MLGNAVSPELVSGGSLITRPLSSGQQIISENSEFFPVGKPIPKVESLPQASGEFSMFIYFYMKLICKYIGYSSSFV